jgi:predicted porin
LAGRYDFKVGKDSEAGFSIAYNRAGSDLDQDYDHDEDYDGLSEIVFGARGSIDNFSFAGSYSDAKHFGQTLSRNNVYFNEYRNKFYTLGVAYSLGGASTSLTYIHQKLLQGSGSNVPVDITKAVSFGVDYVLFEGVKAYAEVTRFSIINSWYQIVNSKPKNTGTVGLVGTKIKI